jgi:hypothetical protein
VTLIGDALKVARQIVTHRKRTRRRYSYVVQYQFSYYAPVVAHQSTAQHSTVSNSKTKKEEAVLLNV